MSTISVEPLDVNPYERGLVFEQLTQVVAGITCRSLEGLLNAVLEDEVTHRLGRAPGAPRQQSSGLQVPWACHRRGATAASGLKRNGHYPRGLQTTAGSLALRVPMLRCLYRVCGAAQAQAVVAGCGSGGDVRLRSRGGAASHRPTRGAALGLAGEREHDPGAGAWLHAGAGAVAGAADQRSTGCSDAGWDLVHRDGADR